MYVLFNSVLSGANACLVAYNRPTNLLYLSNDAGTGLVAGTVTPGVAGSVANSQCTLASGGAVAASGTNLTVPVNLTFKAAFSGAKNVYMLAVDSSGTLNSSSWTLK